MRLLQRVVQLFVSGAVYVKDQMRAAGHWPVIEAARRTCRMNANPRVSARPRASIRWVCQAAEHSGQKVMVGVRLDLSSFPDGTVKKKH
jgi:hypothetical protein